MHILCLGVDILVAGNVLKTIVDSDSYQFWGDGDEEQKLLCAWQKLKEWARQSGWKHSVPRFAPKKLKSAQHPYPELQSKAWNARVVIQWLSSALEEFSTALPADGTIQLMKECVTCLASFHRIGELNGRFLTKSVAQRMGKLCALAAVARRCGPSTCRREVCGGG
ncbi:unnamed protein product [Durusdinium trenchii]|uniref:Uncharacterized protein n=1 Tax=Durusdinium trenchii TaxID=1381693 RepID=A0ABP0T026_9DINO